MSENKSSQNISVGNLRIGVPSEIRSYAGELEAQLASGGLSKEVAAQTTSANEDCQIRLTPETRVALTPLAVKKLKKLGFKVVVEKDAGIKAGFTNDSYVAEGAEIASADEVWNCDVIAKINPPTNDQVQKAKEGSLLIANLVPYSADSKIDQLVQKKVNAISLELIPRTSRAQSMDVLSSQAGIAGYRASLEAGTQYLRFVPMMMTSAGMAKPAKAIVLGAGVAGLQAIATLKKMGAQVEAYDVRPEVKEQIESLGAKFIELDIGESGSGTGGYAKELSAEAKAKQQKLLTDKLKTADIIVTTANIPGRKAPVLVTDEAVNGMRAGSVIIDMAAPTGGNCTLTKPNCVIKHNNVTIVGITNYPSLVPGDSSQFFAGNICHLMNILVDPKAQGGNLKINLNFEDDILNASTVSFAGERRNKK